MKTRILLLVAGLLLLSTTAFAGSPDALPQAKEYSEAEALVYLQRAYFALEQAMVYAGKSQEAKPLKSCDYNKLITDIRLIKEDLGLYLYPREQKVRGGGHPFKIDGDYFLDNIINEK
jgi:hypothetical protein